MAAPFFSIVLPTYNRARMARTAVKTVQWQTSPDWECLIVDDGSSDKTAQALEAFHNDPRIRIFRNERNLGMNASRNLAIREAKGRFVTFLDSDDLWLPRRLDAFRGRMERTPDAGFLFSNAYLWRFGRLTGTLFDPEREIPEGKLPGHYAVGDKKLPYVTTNVAIRRDAFETWGLFKTEMKTLDTELFARFVGGGLPVAAIGKPLSVRRLHAGQLTDRHVENFRESLLAMEASGATPEERASLRAEIAREVAVYLIKAGEPAKAREFMLSELGSAPPLLAMAARIPAPVLHLGRGLRQAWLMARHHPVLETPELSEVRRQVEPLLAAEERA